MISPESGIHRPSNNGAPAIQTLGSHPGPGITAGVMPGAFLRFAFQRAPQRIAVPLETRG